MTVASLDLELDVFAGPFDLLIAVLLREEVDLLEVELGEVVVAYIEHLEREGELELEVATEFLVLIASLLELKSRLLLPGADGELEELGVALGDLLTPPPEVDVSHIRPTVSLEKRLRALREALKRSDRVDFDELFGEED